MNPNDLYGTNINPGNTLMLGKVVDNLDEHKRGRIKVFLPQIHEKEATAGMSWAMPISPGFGGGTSTEADPNTNNWGFYAVPRIGDWVAILALYGDMSTLFYIGGIMSAFQPLHETPDTANTTDPSTYELRFHNGHRLVARTGVDSELQLETEKGHVISIDDANDKIEVKTVKNYSITIDDINDNMVLTIGNASITMTSGGAITINGSTITASASGAVTVTGATIALN